MFTFSRRATLFTATAFAGAGVVSHAKAAPAPKSAWTPFPLSDVRLKPSIFLTSIETNQKYLLALEPDRLLHNFRTGAGLEPKGALYGGWEARGIAGHSLGHYQSACSLMFAQTGDERFKDRALYITRELAEIQAKQGDGYAGGTTVDRGGKTLDGKVVYEELRRGDIRTSGFDLNGGWVPVYTYHKVFAGALDAHKYCMDAASLKVAIGLGDYFGKIIEGLSDDQVQQILRAEHGGINESYAELYARTGDKRWLTLSQRLCHKAVLDPLAQGRDELNGKHANTQIPKVIGAARIYELTQGADHAKTALFFWETVTKDHSYVIGGNSDHEHFGMPRQLSTRLDQQTCEACNTYNMLRLTRHLYGWSGDARYFDFYERAHLNHIMSQQDPATGMFSYFSPLVSGFGRVHSTPDNDFWCCVGSGMESHSKHGESIYWKSGNRVAINLYYASSLNWADKGFKLDMDTAFPLKDTVSIRVTQAPKQGAPELALRVPVWAKSLSLTLNGKALTTAPKDGYITLTGLKTGDKIDLTLPMTTYHEAMPDDANLIAFLSGPLVLAADLGPMSAAWEGYDPAIVADTADGVLKSATGDHAYTLADKGRPDDLTLRPYFAQHNNRTAVYFRRFSPAEWQTVEVGYKADAKARAALAAATVDHIRLGEQQPEKDHNFDGTPNTSVISHLALRGRMMNRGYFQFEMAVRPGTLALQVTYAGRDRNKDFNILIDGQPFVRERLEGEPTTTMNTKTYPLPANLTAGKSKIAVRFEADRDQWTSVYDVRLFRTDTTKPELYNKLNQRIPMLKTLTLAALTATVAFAPLMASAQAKTETVEATLKADKPGPEISRYVYGQFSEHLGLGVYEGIWVGENSSIPNTRGIRNDVVAALKAIKMPVVRWPGGCFADEYHWRDGIGERSKRPSRKNNWWGGTPETNEFGTHEFFDFVEQVGTDAYLSINVGSSTPKEMREWIEYLTSSGTDTLANERRANGRDAPFKVPFIGIGNESWGCGGNMTPEYYADEYRRFSAFFHKGSDNPALRIASGSNADDVNWTDVLTKNAGKQMDGISLHYYTLPTANWTTKGPATNFPIAQWNSTFYQTTRMDKILKDHIAAMDKNDPEKRIGLYVDEWGTWYDVESGTNPGHLYQQNTLRDGIVAASNFNIFHRYTERVKMTNIAQTINVLQAMILTDKEKMTLTPTYYSYKMYVPFHDATPLPVEVTAPTLTAGKDKDGKDQTFPAFNVTAAKAKDGKTYVGVANMDATRGYKINIDLGTLKAKKVSGDVLTSDKLDAHNVPGQKEVVTIAAFKGGKIANGKLTLDVPAKSVVVVGVE